jgi:hypothetical protein
MDLDHVRSDTFEVNDHEHVAKTRRRRCILPWISIWISVLGRSMSPHGIIPGAGTFRDNTSVNGRVSHSA